MAVVCAVSGARDVALLRADEVREQRLGVAQRVLERGRVAQPVAQPLDDGALRRGGVGGGVAEQGRERGAHAGPGEHRVHGELAQADPELDLLERQAPVLGEAGHVAGDEQQRRRLGPRQREGVLAEGPAGQVAGGRAELHAEEDRAEREGELPEQPAEAARRVGVELAQVHGRGHGRRALLLRLDHRLETGR